MKNILMICMACLLALGIQAQSRVKGHPMGKWIGVWEKVGEAGNVELIIRHDKILYDDDIWDYKVERQGKRMTVSISNNGKGRQFDLEERKNGQLLFKNIGDKKGHLLTCKPQQATTPEKAYTYNPQKVNPLFFTKGKAFIKGYIANRPEEPGQYLKLSYEEPITRQKYNKVVEVNPDGTFLAAVEVPYPCYVNLIGDFFHHLFVVPGETLVVYLDCEQINNRQAITEGHLLLGNSLSAQVNRHSAPAEELLLKKQGGGNIILRPEEVKTIESAIKHRNAKLDLLERVLEEAPGLLASLPVSRRTKDILTTNAVADILSDIFDIDMIYDNNRYERVSDTEWKANENFVPLLSSGYYDFLTKHYDVLVDNMLMLSSSSTWVPFNRAAFRCVGFVQQFDNDFFRLNSWSADSTMTQEQKEQSYTLNSICNFNLKLLDDYNAKAVQYVGEEPWDSLPTKNWHFNLTFEHLQRDFSIDKGFLLEAAIVHKLPSNIEDVNGFGEILIGLLPHLKNPIVIREVLNKWRTLICEQEGGTTSGTYPEVTRFFNEIRKKYDTPLIVLDFWGLGCGPCRSSMISQRELVEKYAGKVTFLYLCNEKENPEQAVEKFFTEKDIKGESMRIGNDLWLLLQSHFNFTGIPHVELMDKAGNIIKEDVYIAEQSLDKLLNGQKD